MDEDFLDDVGHDDDEVGYDDIVGALEDLDPRAAEAFEVGNRKRRRRILGAVFGGPAAAIGAAIARRRQKKAQSRMAKNRFAASPGRALSTPRGIVPASQRRVPLGLGSANVAAGATAILSAVVQRPLQPGRLVLSSDTLAAFLVNDIKVGSMSQLAGTSGLAAETFSDVAQDVGVMFTPAGSGITVSVSVTNTGAQAAVISGTLLGLSSEV